MKKIIFLTLSYCFLSFGLLAEERWKCPKGDVLVLLSSPETMPERITVKKSNDVNWFFYLGVDTADVTHWIPVLGDGAIIIWYKDKQKFKYSAAPNFAGFCEKLSSK